jgi:hypothetical protein
LPAATVQAEVHGGIEIGAKGIKATVVHVSPNSDGFELAVKLADTTNTTLVAGLARTGEFDPKAVEETAAAVGRYFNKMKADFQVSPERIYIVGSSGLFSPLQDKPDQVKANRQVLSEAIRKATGATMTFIDAKREAELSMIGIVPRKYRDQAVLLDVGSGNTKGGYFGARNQITSISIPYGTVSFSELVKKAGGSFAESASSLRDEKLAPALRKELSAATDMTTRSRVYLSGGIVWATASLTHPEETRPFTPFAVKDIDDLQRRLAADPDRFPAPDVSAISDETKRSRALKEIQSVQKVFTTEQLLAGTHVLKAVATEMQLDSGKKEICFARYGNLGWILAYVTEKEKAPTGESRNP